MKAKYDKIGSDYNLTRKADKYLTNKLLDHLKPKENGLYLDIGCGTGNYTNEFQKKGYEFIGIDPSEKMLKEAQAKNDKINWKIGTAENTGLPDNHVDGILGSLTIHHWDDLLKGFQELHRVLKQNSQIVIFTSTSEQMKGYWLNHYFPIMLEDSMNQMPSLVDIKTAMSSSGFEIVGTDTYSIRPDLEDQFLYCGKQNPELYFDENIRNGISSFSSLANQEEIKTGLTKLKADVNSGQIIQIIKSYENEMGDYLYIIGKNT